MRNLGLEGGGGYLQGLGSLVEEEWKVAAKPAQKKKTQRKQKEKPFTFTKDTYRKLEFPKKADRLEKLDFLRRQGVFYNP